MMTLKLTTAIVFLFTVPSVMQAQAQAETGGVQLAVYDDGLSSGTYAYVRGEGGVVARVDDGGIAFVLREPVVVWACQAEALTMVYRFDTELLGEEAMVQVRYRFDAQPASSALSWPMVIDPQTTAQIEMMVAMLGGPDSPDVETNPMLQMMMGTAIAAGIPPELIEEFVATARNSTQMRLQVMDPADGENYTDVFSLSGLVEALDELRKVCP